MNIFSSEQTLADIIETKFGNEDWRLSTAGIWIINEVILINFAGVHTRQV